MSYINYNPNGPSTQAAIYSASLKEVQEFETKIKDVVSVIRDPNASISDKLAAYQFLLSLKDGSSAYSNISDSVDLASGLIPAAEALLANQTVQSYNSCGPGPGSWGWRPVTAGNHAATILDIIKGCLQSSNQGFDVPSFGHVTNPEDLKKLTGGVIVVNKGSNLNPNHDFKSDFDQVLNQYWIPSL